MKDTVPDEQFAVITDGRSSADPSAAVPADGATPKRRAARWLRIEIVVAVVLLAIAVVALLARGGDGAFAPDSGAGDQPVLEMRWVPANDPVRGSWPGPPMSRVRRAR
jgi:hypothetical protein